MSEAAAGLTGLLLSVLSLVMTLASFFFNHSMAFAVDVVTLIGPVLLGSTLLSDHAAILISTCLSISLATLLLCSLNKCEKQEQKQSKSILASDMSGKRPFVGAFRAYVLIATSIVILAVDFVILPRRFAKTETFGSGIMDVGVGAFVISHSIVSPEARGLSPNDAGFILSVVKAFKSSLPLLVLGIARFLSVKSTDYQQHVSEYGIHWNFFFTLFVVKVTNVNIT